MPSRDMIPSNIMFTLNDILLEEIFEPLAGLTAYRLLHFTDDLDIDHVGTVTWNKCLLQ